MLRGLLDLDPVSVLSSLGFFLLAFQVVSRLSGDLNGSLSVTRALLNSATSLCPPAISFFQNGKEPSQTAFMKLHPSVPGSNVRGLLCLSVSNTFLQKNPSRLNQLYTPYNPPRLKPKQPTTTTTTPTFSATHPRPSHSVTNTTNMDAQPPPPWLNNMDAPWLNVPQATYQPKPPPPRPDPHSSSNDIEQQAGLAASNPAPGPNSVRTRVFSGLLMFAVIALVVIILVTTSGHLAKPGRVHKHH